MKNIVEKQSLINKVQNYGFRKAQVDSMLYKLEVIFEYLSDEEQFFVPNLMNYLEGDNNMATIYKLIDDEYKEAKKQNYIQNIIPMRLGLDLSKFELTENIVDYINTLKDVKSYFISDLSSVLNSQIINFGVCTENGLFFPLYKDSGFQSHDELIEYLGKNGKIQSTFFLEIGSRVSTAGNGFPIIRVQDLNDTNNNVRDCLKKYIITSPMVYAIFNKYNNVGNNSLMFENFIMKNIKNIGSKQQENNKLLRLNLHQFTKYLERDQFDINFALDIMDNNVGEDFLI